MVTPVSVMSAMMSAYPIAGAASRVPLVGTMEK